MIEVAWCFGGDKLLGSLPQLARQGLSGWIAGETKNPGQNPNDVAINHRLLHAVSDRKNSSGGVTANAGQREDLPGLGRELTLMFIANHLRGTMEKTGTTVVTQSGPLRQDIVERRICQRNDIGKAGQKAGIVRDDGFDSSLLEHDLRHPNGIGVGGLSPRELALSSLIPAQQLLAKILNQCLDSFSPGVRMGRPALPNRVALHWDATMLSSPTLTYCTNVHPSQTLAELQDSLQRWTLPLARRLAAAGHVSAEFPIGLYLSAQSVAELQDVERRRDWQRWIDDQQLRVVTLNCFPFGAFHAESVKHSVFRPGWHEPQRLEYTKRAAKLFADWIPVGGTGSISTCSGTWKGWHTESTLTAIAHHWWQMVIALQQLESETGRRIVLAIEPEPLSTLETSSEVVQFFEEVLFDREVLASSVPDCSRAQAEQWARTYLTVCYDTCHQAVEFEDGVEALERLHRAGIRIGKVQLSNALRLQSPGTADEARQFLASFAEPRYLHQAIAKNQSGQVTRYQDLPEFLADELLQQWQEVRVHFHIPIHHATLPLLGTTQDHLMQVLRHSMQNQRTDLYEIETYTYDVFPQRDLRASSPVELETSLFAEWSFAAKELRRH